MLVSCCVRELTFFVMPGDYRQQASKEIEGDTGAFATRCNDRDMASDAHAKHRKKLRVYPQE
jgi:hypothetical protein